MLDITQRINRIVGQLRGIEKMIKSERECHEILQQISAAKKAIDLGFEICGDKSLDHLLDHLLESS